MTSVHEPAAWAALGLGTLFPRPTRIGVGSTRRRLASLLVLAAASVLPAGEADRTRTKPADAGIYGLSADTLLAQGRERLAEGKPVEALTVLELARMREPNNADAWFLIGKTNIEHVSMQDGIAALEQCRQLAPRRPGMHLLLGKAYVHTVQPGKAVAALLKARAISGRSAALCFWLAMAYMDQQKWRDAEQELARVPDSGNPFSGRKHFNLALVAMLGGNRQAGLAAIKRAVQVERDPVRKAAYEVHMDEFTQGKVTCQQHARAILAWRTAIRTGKPPAVASGRRSHVPPEVRERARLEQARRDARARLKSAQAELVKASARYGTLDKERTRLQSALQQAKSSGDAAAIAKAQAALDKVDAQRKSINRQRLQQVAAMKAQFKTIAACTKKLNELKKRTGR